MSIKKVFFVFLLMNVTSGRLKGIVLSVSMLRFQYIIIIIIIIITCKTRHYVALCKICPLAAS